MNEQIQIIHVIVNIFGTIASILLLCMIYQLNKSQQERANKVAEQLEIRNNKVDDKVDAVKDRLVITTNEEAKDQSIRELKTFS